MKCCYCGVEVTDTCGGTDSRVLVSTPPELHPRFGNKLLEISSGYNVDGIGSIGGSGEVKGKDEGEERTAC